MKICVHIHPSLAVLSLKYSIIFGHEIHSGWGNLVEKVSELSKRASSRTRVEFSP